MDLLINERIRTYKSPENKYHAIEHEIRSVGKQFHSKYIKYE